jgi:hypothetical protein
MKKHYRTHGIVIGLYLLLTLALTWPLARYITTHIPGEATWAFDEATFIWNLWWFKFSILELQQTPLESNYIFFPLGIKLTTYTFNLFNAALALPLQLALTLPLANNLTLFFSYISSAYGTFLLSLYLLHQPAKRDQKGQRRKFLPLIPNIPYLAAFAAGAVFAFSASRMMYLALGHYNFVTIQWFPFYLLFLLRALRHGRFKTIFVAALSAALCIYAELTYSVFLLFLTLLILTGEWAGDRHTRKQGRASTPYLRRPLATRLLRLSLIGLITLIMTAPFILSVLPDFLDPAYAEPGWGEGLKLSADLVGLVTLTPLQPLSGLDWITELRAVIERTSRFNDANTLFLGYGILITALLGYLVRRSEARVWLWSALCFTLLSLGPLLTINGQNRFDLDGLETTFPLPFALLHYLPILNANRVPNRFGIPLTLSLALLVGYGLAWLLERFGKLSNRRIIFYPLRFTFYVLLLALLLFDQYSVPLPLTDARIPRLYDQIGAEPGAFTLMQLPLGWRNSYGTLGAERTQLEYYQAAHRRPMLGGNTSRNPDFKFDYYANIPLFAAITAVELYHTPDDLTLDRARRQAADLMTLYNIKYLVIHEPIPFRKPYEDTFSATQKLTLDLIPHQATPTYQSPGVQAFAVRQADIPDPLTIDFGDWTGDPYRGEGWAGNEEIFAATANWATGREALIFFPVRGSGDRLLSIQVAPFSFPGAPEQQVSLRLNGYPLDGLFLLREGWQPLETRLPEAYLSQGLNRLTLNFAYTAQPRQVLPANTAIGATGLTTPVDLELNSGPDFAFMTVGFGDGAVDASTHRRGLNVAVVHPQSGELVRFKGFDTAANEFEAAALSQFIAETQEGFIVIMATQGLEAMAYFNEETRVALQSIGLSTEKIAPPFSVIGVKGARVGTALQAVGESGGYLRLGGNADTRNLAAAVAQVTISLP